MAAPARPGFAVRTRSSQRFCAWFGLLLLSTATVVLAACGGTAETAPAAPKIACVYDSTRAWFWERSEFWRDAEAADARSMVACLGIGAKDALGRTPLHLAAEHGADPAVIAVLLEHGARTGATDDYGDTPLHLAVEHDANPAVIAVLVEHGADIEARNDFGDTPLHVAANEGYATVVQVLLDFGANIEARDNLDNSPLEAAAHRGDRATMAVLLDRGANVGNLYWNAPALRQLIDDRGSGTQPAASAAPGGA